MSKEKLVPKLRFEHFKNAEYWTNFELGELSNIVRGASPRPIQDPKWFDKDSTVGWLRISDVTRQNGRIYYLDQRISKAGQEKTRVLKSPHLLISIAATVGKPVINYVDTGVHDGFLIFKDPIFDKEFMYQWLEMFRLNWFRYGQPGSQINLNSNLVKNQNVYLPLLQEQEKIGKFFVKLDELIQLQQSKVNKVKDIKSAYLSEMFPKEGEKYPKKRFEGFTKPWKLTKFNEIADVERGLTYHPSDIVEKDGVRVLRSSNIDEDTFITKDDDVFVNENAINIEFSQKQNILITSANGSPHLVGKHAILEQLETPSVHGGFMLLARTASPYFLNASMSSDWYRKFIRYHVAGGGGSIGNIKKSDLEHQLIYIPSKEEQEKIGQFFKNLDKQITIEEEKLSKLEKLKQAYLNDMFV